jgi:hypothetical protein
MRARRLRLYRGKMTPGEPLDDDVFINSNFLAKGPIHKAGVKTADDQSSFFCIGSVTGWCSAEYGTIEATTGYVFRPEGLRSAESEGADPGVWRRRSRRRQSLTGTPPHRGAANPRIEQPQGPIPERNPARID